jgi:hypothetical protein
LLWGRQLGTDGTEEYGSVSADPLGGVYVSGRTTGSLGGPNAGPGGVGYVSGDQFLVKYDANGSLLWTRQIGALGEETYARVAADGLGNVYISGSTPGNVGGPNAGGNDTYLRKYASDGTLLWGRQLGTNVGDGGGGVAADALGNVFISSGTYGSLGGPNAGDADAFIAKYNADGTHQWTRQFGSTAYDSASYQYGSLATDGKGNVYVAATLNASVEGSTITLVDVYFAKYDTNGSLVWEQFFDGGHPRISTDGRGNVFTSSGSIRKFLDPTSPGDFNADGTVDAADYIVWRSGLGTSYSQSDYNLWRANFGRSAAGAAAVGNTLGATNSGNIPEPGALLLTAMALFLCRLPGPFTVLFRRRR